MKRADQAIPPRIFDTPQPIARLFLTARHLAAFHGRVRTAGAGAARHFRERANVLKPPAATCCAAGRDPSRGCRPVQDAQESGGAWDQPERQKFGSMFSKNI